MSDVPECFEKFLLAPVLVIEENGQLELGKENQVVDSIEVLAIETKLKIRHHLPGWMSTCDWKEDRLNVYIEKVGDTFKITELRMG